MNSNRIFVVPARMAATRLPGKPLADIGGVPLIVHVLRSIAAWELGPVLVAAGDPEIADCVCAAGFEAVDTDAALPSGTDRVFAAIEAWDPDKHHTEIVNVQGDLPFVDKAALLGAIGALARGADIGTVAAPLDEALSGVPDRVKVTGTPLGGKFEEGSDPNADPKAIQDTSRVGTIRAHWFSRAAILSPTGKHLEHVGIYAYRRDSLARFVRMGPSAMERIERLEQLRALEGGMIVNANFVKEAPLGIDTPEDLARARSLYTGLRHVNE